MGKLGNFICLRMPVKVLLSALQLWLVSYSFSQSSFHGEIQLNDRLRVPLDLYYASASKPVLTLLNGQEAISMRFLKQLGDSIYFEFPEVAGQLVFHAIEKKGYWVNLNKLQPSIFPFQFYPVSPNKNSRTDAVLDTLGDDFSGIYDVEFTDNEGITKAVGIFEQNKGQVTGTFRTTTGDYRFLAGGVTHGKLSLSCFDGIHAYLFEAIMTSPHKISGDFYSGAKYHATWEASLNDTAQLPSGFSTSSSIIGNDYLSIVVKTIRGKKRKFDVKQFKGHPTVIQIMGTWCPNCLDETKYFINLCDSLPFKDIRFMGVAFEHGKTDHEKIARLKTLNKKMHIPYPIYLGGNASSQAAHAVFNQLTGIFAFPTTVFLNKKGQIIAVHTGFDGPGTGVHYKNLQRETESLLLKLLHE